MENILSHEDIFKKQNEKQVSGCWVKSVRERIDWFKLGLLTWVVG